MPPPGAICIPRLVLINESPTATLLVFAGPGVAPGATSWQNRTVPVTPLEASVTAEPVPENCGSDTGTKVCCAEIATAKTTSKATVRMALMILSFLKRCKWTSST